MIDSLEESDFSNSDLMNESHGYRETRATTQLTDSLEDTDFSDYEFDNLMDEQSLEDIDNLTSIVSVSCETSVCETNAHDAEEKSLGMCMHNSLQLYCVEKVFVDRIHY